MTTMTPPHPAASASGEHAVEPMPTYATTSTPSFLDQLKFRYHRVMSLLSASGGDISDILKLRGALLQRELSSNAKAAGRGIAYVAAGAVVGVLTIITLTACLIAGITALMPFSNVAASVALAALIVTAIYGIGAYVLISRGLHNWTAEKLIPKRSVDEVHRDINWLRGETR